MFLENSIFLFQEYFWVFLLAPFKLVAVLIEMVLHCSYILEPPSPQMGLPPLVARNRNKLNLTIEWCSNISEIIHFLNISFLWLGSTLKVI